jgi:hypothetical protein
LLKRSVSFPLSPSLARLCRRALRAETTAISAIEKAVSDQQNGNEDDFKCEVELRFATLEFERKREEIPKIALNAGSGDHQ